MSDDGRIAKRYARALLDLCAPFNNGVGGSLEATQTALNGFAQTWREQIELRNVLQNPSIPLHERVTAVRATAEKLLSGDTNFAGFLAVLVENGRIVATEAIAKEFARLVAQFKKMLTLEVTSAIEVPEAERQRMLQEIQSSVPADVSSMVSIQWRVDPDLLGGLQIKAGDKLLDGSIRGSLDRIGKELAQVSESAAMNR